MIKLAELFIVLFFLILAFFVGVSYSSEVKSGISWIFENQQNEQQQLNTINNNPEF